MRKELRAESYDRQVPVGRWGTMEGPHASADVEAAMADATPFQPVPRAWRLAFRRSRPTKSARALAAGPRAAARARKGERSGEAAVATFA
eukprot:5930334-Pleurochrysis_carterae.AAC.1